MSNNPGPTRSGLTVWLIRQSKPPKSVKVIDEDKGNSEWRRLRRSTSCSNGILVHLTNLSFLRSPLGSEIHESHKEASHRSESAMQRVDSSGHENESLRFLLA